MSDTMASNEQKWHQGSQSKGTELIRPNETLLKFLKTLGLENYYPNKLTLKSLLEINSTSLSDEEGVSLKEIPWAFLRKLLMVNLKSRSLSCTVEENIYSSCLFDEEDCDNDPNFLDLYTAIFACADCFLQQEMVLKMSMCQFAVPFVLPQGVYEQCTLMLWALRSIQKEWRPHSMSELKGFVEDSVVHAKIPLISFVRFSNCSLSKSQVLNQILNSSEQHHDFFSHREMIGGSAPRVIANGLVEICWTLPSGNSSIDVFPEPVAIANLRGDAYTFETQFRFLTQVSAAVFVFLDSVEEKEQRLLTSLKERKSNIFFVVNSHGNINQNVRSSIEIAINTLQLKRECIIKKTQKINMANFSKIMRSSIRNVLSQHNASCEIESLKIIAQKAGVAVDEMHNRASVVAEGKVEDIIKFIKVCQITDYKNTQLPLQGDNWKRLAQIEKEQCRLQNSGELSLETYKVQLQNEKEDLLNKQSQYTMTKTMDLFNNALLTSDDAEKAFFLKWMGLKLDLRSRNYLSALRHKYKDCEQKKDRDGINKLDKELLDGSLGIEHYMRELGQIYQAVSLGSSKLSDKINNLPSVVAHMLLAGFPLELLDGDASNIPEKWVRDVLKELHMMVGQKSRLLVLTVLGVQSSGKSTLLNTMFGVQFAVSSGRCTRGAYMLFLPVGKDLKEELRCDFILLIDTEGLKSPALAKLEDSYEHDNELATFVIGLSDVTIINIAMENSTEMKDVLQIAVHAFLRMKEVGKKTVCHFVHQNVAGVSAHDKNKTDRNQLLEQLNEMTVIAAEMEKRPNVRKFTDVLDYDVEKNNWYIPGLWHGTPPMASVNTGYSAAVFNFRKNLLEMLRIKQDVTLFQIPDFLKWMSSLWRAVKYENFIFSFRNSLVAHAYDNLCKEFSEWEWTYRRHIHSVIESATVHISNNEVTDMQLSQVVIDPLKETAEKEIVSQTAVIYEKLKNYYKRKDVHIHLVEKYKTDFVNGIKSLESEMKDEVRKKLNAAFETRANLKKAELIQREKAIMIEQQVLQLLQKNKHHKNQMSDEDLKTEFEKMWRKVLGSITGLKEKNVPNDVLRQMRTSLGNLKVTEDLQKVRDLTKCGQSKFEVKDDHVPFLKKVKCFFTQRSAKQNLEMFACEVINSCIRIIEQHTQSKHDYQTTHIKDVLEEIDEQLQKTESKVNTKFVLDLKLHICGIAAREFSEMHKKFLASQDPVRKLEKLKSRYLLDFIDLYREKDQCHRKAEEFVQLCLKPAIIAYINKSIGTDIVDKVLANFPTEYSSRTLFQYTIQNELLENCNFDEFLEYIYHYKSYVTKWIYNHIIECFSKDMTLQELKMKKLKIVIEKIMKVVETSKYEKDGSPLPNNVVGTNRFIHIFCKALSNVLSISRNLVEGIFFQNTSKCNPFTNILVSCLNDLKNQLEEEISKSNDIKETLSNVSVKPQNELFKRVFGCGKKCPFCKTPCEAGGRKHAQHFATVHRPRGLGGFVYMNTNVLCEEICSSSILGGGMFRSQETEFEPHPSKSYQNFYPDWYILPDSSVQSPDYWKFVLVTFNDKFAQLFEAEPAVYPNEWKKITKIQALFSLKQTFDIK